MSFVWTNTLISIISFLILYWFLSKYAFGPLMGVMEKRRQLVQEQIGTAESNRTEALRLLEEQKQALQQARQEAVGIIEQARATSSRQSDEAIAAARAESTRIKEDALKDIENEKNKAVTALRSQVSAMSVMIASKIIEKQVDEKSQEQLIENYLNDVGGRQ